MVPHLSLIEKIKLWICNNFGHWKKYSHDFMGKHHYTCRLCGIIISEEIEEADE